MRRLVSVCAFLATVLTLTVAMANDVFFAEQSSGSGDGSSCANARAVSLFNDVGSWGTGADQLGPGSTAHLCGTISTSLEVRGSGSEAAPLAILFEQGAKLSQPRCPGATSDACLNTNGHAHLTIDGGTDGIIENTDSGTGKQHESSYAVLAKGCDGCEIKNLTIQNIYVQQVDDTSVDQTTVRCIDFSGSDLQIHDNVMHDAGWCLTNSYEDGDTNVRVYNNEIYNIDHAYMLASASGAHASGFYFYKNHVHDYANWDTSTNAYHHDGIHAFGVNGARATELWIYDNLFDGDIGGHLTGHVFLEGGSGPGSTPWTDDSGVAHVFNNVFIGNKLVYGLVQLYLGSNYEVYNNTIVGFDSSDGKCLNVSSKNAKIKNNFVAGCNQLVSLSNTTFVDPAADLDHNVYANCNSYNCWWYNAIDTANFDSWKSQCGCDGDSVDATKDLTGGLDAAWHPMDGSVVIGAGANLSSLGYADLNEDREGVPRPSGDAPWDVGAYAYCPGGCVPPDAGPGASTGVGAGGSTGPGATTTTSGAGTGAAGAGGANGAAPDGGSANDGGCGCRAARDANEDGRVALATTLLAAALASQRRRRAPAIPALRAETPRRSRRRGVR